MLIGESENLDGSGGPSLSKEKQVIRFSESSMDVSINKDMRAFLSALPPNITSIILFDQAGQVLGFAVLDRSDKRRRAKIYNSDCKEVKEVVSNTTVKEAVDVLLKGMCTYVT